MEKFMDIKKSLLYAKQVFDRETQNAERPKHAKSYAVGYYTGIRLTAEKLFGIDKVKEILNEQ